MDATDEPAQVDPDAEGKHIQIEANAATVTKFEIQVRGRLESAAVLNPLSQPSSAALLETLALR